MLSMYIYIVKLKKSDPYDPCGFFRLTTTGRMVVTYKTAKPLIVSSSVIRVVFSRIHYHQHLNRRDGYLFLRFFTYSCL